MKAKDLRGKNIEDVEKGGQPEEEDAVTAAYENISKRLDSIRNGKADESKEPKESEDEDDDQELEEWKGPKKPELKDIEPEEEDTDIRKVKLHSLDNDQESEESEESEESDESDAESEESRKAEKAEWEPKANDPLDEEDGREPEESKESDESKESEDDFEKEEIISPKMKDQDEDLDSEEADSRDIKNEDQMEEDNSRNLRTAVPETDLDEMESDVDIPQRKYPQPDTLDDLTEARSAGPMLGGLDDEEYDIPSLKGSRQEGSNLSYNTHPQREGLGQSYSPKGSYMDGNDPNNFFSQHQQPQAPKRANKFHLLILVIIGIVVIGFTVYILKGGFGEISITSQPSPSPSATATPTPTPTPTPEPQIERGNFTIKVLNGTTTSGLAGKIRDKLKELGYKTATPGNNSDTDVAQTEIRVKEGSDSAQLFERLKLDLAPDYDAKQGDNLDKKSTNDAEVIIGAK